MRNEINVKEYYPYLFVVSHVYLVGSLLIEDAVQSYILMGFGVMFLILCVFDYYKSKNEV